MRRRERRVQGAIFALIAVVMLASAAPLIVWPVWAVLLAGAWWGPELEDWYVRWFTRR